ncbi:LysR family transcriptional regulator [Reinekea thalattae]|uniref:LysR family transcriptional regulator n=1 Tax=Reinekea thalattae TaxID=2593301 RepID=A0A5C8Z4E0_9GAMM|nr:LysR family transcriptional regulator [Reinekea thalattae]TXR52041.1 LysR family transcriptional regulator [Reinekea thalattae]
MRQLNSLATFIQVAKDESVTKAAARLHLTQQAVSQQIKKLEEELGVKLFNRAHRKIYLTPEGEQLLKHASGYLAALESEMLNLKNDSQALTGHISISCTLELATLVLAPVIEQFKQQQPQVTLQIDLQSDATSVDNVKQGKTDIGIVVFSSGEKLIDISPLRKEAFITVASAQYLKHHGPIEKFEQILMRDIIDYQMDCPSMRTWLAKNNKALVKKLELKTAAIAANDDRLIKDFVMQGLGVANLPRLLVANELKEKQLIEILPNAKSISAGIDIITMKDRILPAQVAAFLKVLKSPLSN